MMADTQCDSLADVIKCQGGRGGDCKVHKKLRSIFFKKSCIKTLEKMFLKSSHELEEVGWKIEWLEDERFSSALPLARGAQCFCILISAGVILGHYPDFICVSHLQLTPLSPCTNQLPNHFDGNAGKCSSVFSFINAFFFFSTFCVTVLPSVRYWVIVSPRTQGGRGRENRGIRIRKYKYRNRMWKENCL